MTKAQLSELTALILKNLHNVSVDEPTEVSSGGYKAIEVVVRRKDLGRWWSVGIQEAQSDESVAVAIGKVFSEAVQAR